MADQIVSVWLDTTSDDHGWVVDTDIVDGGESETIKMFPPTADGFRRAVSFAEKAAEKRGLEVEVKGEESDSPWPKKISICGNWRENGPDREWAGSGTVDHHGSIECSAELGDEAYEAIEEQIADGDDEGEVTVRNDEQDRDITYYWSME